MRVRFVKKKEEERRKDTATGADLPEKQEGRNAEKSAKRSRRGKGSNPGRKTRKEKKRKGKREQTGEEYDVTDSTNETNAAEPSPTKGPFIDSVAPLQNDNPKRRAKLEKTSIFAHATNQSPREWNPTTVQKRSETKFDGDL